MNSSMEYIARIANDKVHELRSRLNGVEGKVVALQATALQLTDDDITVENVDVKLPGGAADVKPKPPGDSDTARSLDGSRRHGGLGSERPDTLRQRSPGVPRGQEPLQWLLAPHSVDEFSSVYWERCPLILRRTKPEYYSELITLRQFDELLATNGDVARTARVIRGGQDVEIRRRSRTSSASALEEIYAHYRDGATSLESSTFTIAGHRLLRYASS